MGKLQNVLTSVMQKAGSAVEKVAALGKKSKSPKPKKTGLTDDSGQDFGQIQWNEKHIQSLLIAAERKQVLPLIPALGAKKALHLTPGSETYVEFMAKRGATDVVELDVNKAVAGATPRQGGKFPLVKGSIEHLPFRQDLFDFILYPSALAWRSDLPALVPETSRCLNDNGRIVLSMVHPFFEYLMNPRGGFQRSLETIFSTLKKNNFFLEEYKEGTLEEALRTVSLPPKMMQELQRYQGLPLILVIKGIRLRKRKA